MFQSRNRESFVFYNRMNGTDPENQLRFNLVIENLLFSTTDCRNLTDSIKLSFQSRNRESFVFYCHHHQDMRVYERFQSRNRESFVFYFADFFR